MCMCCYVRVWHVHVKARCLSFRSLLWALPISTAPGSAWSDVSSTPPSGLQTHTYTPPAPGFIISLGVWTQVLSQAARCPTTTTTGFQGRGWFITCTCPLHRRGVGGLHSALFFPCLAPSFPSGAIFFECYAQNRPALGPPQKSCIRVPSPQR